MSFESDLFEAADRLRGSVESAEYKHLVLGLIFLKYISDSFERHRALLSRETQNPDSDLYAQDAEERAEVLEDRDEYLQATVFWVPENARFDTLLAAATQPDIGQRIDAALDAIERDNTEQLRGVLPKVYSRSELPPSKLGELVNVIARVGFGADEERARDLLGRTYEYFIKMFARAEGHRGGEFYTPQSVVQLLVEMLEPYEGRVFDPACGSCGMFIQSAQFVKAHGGRARQISIYGQELNHTTGRIGRMNLAIHGLAGNVKVGHSSLTADHHPGLRADFVLANPPFNQEYWGGEQVADDPRWSYGLPPDRNANYAWIQHFIHHLAPDGRAGFVLANGSLSSMAGGEGAIREAIVRDDLVDCIVMCPQQLFFTTQIPVCLWFLDRDKGSRHGRDRRGQTLFIDARALGTKISRTQVEFGPQDLETITSAYRSWRGAEGVRPYEDVPGFCAAADLGTIETNGFILTPGRYIASANSNADGGVHDLHRLQTLLEQQLAESAELGQKIKAHLRGLGASRGTAGARRSLLRALAAIVSCQSMTP